VVEHDICRKVDWALRAYCIASSVPGSNSHGSFLWRLLKGHVYAVPPRTIKGLIARPQAAVTKVDANA
jgi:hypothetical protein